MNVIPVAEAFADPLAARLGELGRGRAAADWPARLLAAARELTLAEAGAVATAGAEGWSVAEPRTDAPMPAPWQALAERARRADGVCVLRGTAGRWVLAVAIGPAGAREVPGVLVLETAAADPADLALTRERMALLAALARAGADGLRGEALAPAALAAAAADGFLRAPGLALGLHAAAATIARHIAPADRVAVGLVRRGRIAALGLSDQTAPVATAPLTKAVTALLEAARDRGTAAAGPADPPTPEERAFAAGFGARALLTVPSRDGRIVLLVSAPPEAGLPDALADRLLPAANLLDAASGGPRPAAARRRRGALAWVAALAALVAVLGLWPVTATVEAPFVLQAAQTRIVAAPYDGIVEASRIQPGDTVAEGEVLARLARHDIALELAAARARVANDRREAAIARADGRPAQEQLALLSARRTEAQIGLLEFRLDLSEIRAPAGGVVVAGDLRRSLGQPVSRGQVLFELALPGPPRAELTVADERIARVAPGQAVVLRPSADPSLAIGGRVERIRPLAELVRDRNVFRVFVALDGAGPEALRPGTEGVARIGTGETTWLAWLIADPLRWLRRQFWI